MTATRYDALTPPTDPTNSRICRIEGVWTWPFRLVNFKCN
jgi:hypothetical protein